MKLRHIPRHLYISGIVKNYASDRTGSIKFCTTDKERDRYIELFVKTVQEALFYHDNAVAFQIDYQVNVISNAAADKDDEIRLIITVPSFADKTWTIATADQLWNASPITGDLFYSDLFESVEPDTSFLHSDWTGQIRGFPAA